MKRNTLAIIFLLSAMQIVALPNLIGRWQTAPTWDRFEKTTLEIDFKDTVHFNIKVVVDRTDFTDDSSSTTSMCGTYHLQDSLCIFTADTTNLTESSAFIPGEMQEVERYLILPSNKSEDMIALIDDRTGHDVFIFYRQK